MRHLRKREILGKLEVPPAATVHRKAGASLRTPTPRNRIGSGSPKFEIINYQRYSISENCPNDEFRVLNLLGSFLSQKI